MQDTFLERMNARLQERGIKGRQDLELHDARVLESGRAVRVLAVYSPLFGPPSTYDVQHWVSARMGEFGGQVVARPETVHAFPEKNFCTFIIEQRTTRQPLSAQKGMIRAGVDQYLDPANVLWEVVKADQGPSYLVRKDGVTVERMLEIRRQALRGGVSGRKNVMLASIEGMPAFGGGYSTAGVGDTVDFYNQGLMHRGKILAVSKVGVKIKSSNSARDIYTVDPLAITAILEKSPAAAQAQDDVVRRYYSRIYPGHPGVETISPSSSQPMSAPGPWGLSSTGEMTASASKAATPEAHAHPTQRVLGRLPGARAAKR